MSARGPGVALPVASVATANAYSRPPSGRSRLSALRVATDGRLIAITAPAYAALLTDRPNGYYTNISQVMSH
jgi:hypothetical protein